MLVERGTCGPKAVGTHVTLEDPFHEQSGAISGGLGGHFPSVLGLSKRSRTLLASSGRRGPHAGGKWMWVGPQGDPRQDSTASDAPSEGSQELNGGLHLFQTHGASCCLLLAFLPAWSASPSHCFYYRDKLARGLPCFSSLTQTLA